MEKPAVPGVNVMLVGAPGSGKTYSLRTFLEAGITPFCIFTEPGFEVVSDLAPKDCHWHYIPPASTSWTSFIDSAEKINTMSFEMLTKLPNINKAEHRQFIDVLKVLSDFKCQRTGESFGPVDSWGTDRVLWFDSLSGLNLMAMALVVGSKPVKSMADWGVAMDNLARLIQKLCMDTRCHFVLTAHLEREVDEVSGGQTLMASTLGRKLAPVLPRFFSDVVQAKYSGGKYLWSTAAINADLKARNLPISENLDPTFKPLVEKWKSRQWQATDSQQLNR